MTAGEVIFTDNSEESVVSKLKVSIQDRQFTYNVHWGAFVQPLIQSKSNKYYKTWVCVFVSLGIRYAERLVHIVVCGLPGSVTFCNIMS
jgi:hypothetical protein